jgi:hypothetical protein
MAAPIAPQVEEAPAINEDDLLEAYLELEGHELAWLGYANEAQVQAELAKALDVTGSS